ncbi:MAG: hypothetical protein COB94_005310 [Gammaproteobacteria bacterium]|nr:hypothetical protein [Gammaproteobacteria bacterium]
MDDRIEALNDLLELKQSIEDLMLKLSKFDWDSEELIVLKKSHVRNIIDRYLMGDIDEVVVEGWANAIECRDDIGLFETHRFILKELVYELANPSLTHKLTSDRAKVLSNKMEF